MIQLTQGGAYLVNGTDIVADTPEAASQIQAKTGITISKEEAAKNTMAYGILQEHNTSGNMDKLKIRFDKLTSHDITFVGIIQTARASGLQKFPMPYVLTNCHNSLCAVGGTINEDDHMFGLTCAKKYGGVYVPPHQAVIHQFAREMLAGGGKMILGSDSHTRYGALGTMAMGEGGPELVKQMLIYGVPTGLQMSIISVSDMTLQAMVNTYGTALIVAYGVCIKVEGVGWQMAEAIGTSLGTFTGQNVGANHLDRVKQGVRCAYLMNAVCYGIFCPVIWFFARPIMEAFTGNPESIRYGVEYMKIFSCFFFVGGILVVYHNILRSAGDVTVTVLMGVSEIITRIGFTFLFTAAFGYYGLWWVSPLTWCCAMMVGCVRYYLGKWEKKAQLQRGDNIHG